jgi:hypothetical protein
VLVGSFVFLYHTRRRRYCCWFLLGNIFIGQGGKVSLIDCGQFKTFSRFRRLQFARIVLAVKDYQRQQATVEDETPKIMTTQQQEKEQEQKRASKKTLADCARGFGITCVQGRESEDDVACAIALVLFSDSGMILPGNFSSNELSPDSPIRLLTSFPQDLVLLGRAAVLLKGIAKSLNVSLSLVDQWDDDCKRTLDECSVPHMPLWGTTSRTTGLGNGSVDQVMIRLCHGGSLLKQWVTDTTRRLLTWWMQQRWPPAKIRMPLLGYSVSLGRTRRRPSTTKR